VVGFLVLLAGLVAGGIYGWRSFAAHRAAKRSSTSTKLPAEAPARSTAEGPGASTQPASGKVGSAGAIPLDLSVAASAATRVRILADGAILLDAELPAGETRHFSAKQQFEVTAGDSSAVLLELNGRAMPPVGIPGRPGTIVLSEKDLRQAPVGSSQP